MTNNTGTAFITVAFDLMYSVYNPANLTLNHPAPATATIAGITIEQVNGDGCHHSPEPGNAFRVCFHTSGTIHWRGARTDKLQVLGWDPETFSTYTGSKRRYLQRLTGFNRCLQTNQNVPTNSGKLVSYSGSSQKVGQHLPMATQTDFGTEM